MRIGQFRCFTAARRTLAAALAGATGLSASTGALAQVGQPVDWQIAMQTPVTATAQNMYGFHTALVWIITVITLFVGALLLIVILRYNERKNPTPSKTSHNTMIEVAWTVIPILILVGIAIPSFRILREQLVIPEPDVIVKATGHSWYWSYEYPTDQGGFVFDSLMLEDDEAAAAGLPRLLAVDNEVVVPVNKVVKLQVTSADVLHAFALPSFGLKIDAVPGRLNETWFEAEREGVYYGQCSELCGARHAFMPIAIRVVSEAEYASWLAEAQTRFAATEYGATRVAATIQEPVR
ncbi:cytochrome c oxidase subunit II [Salinarimonas rosea]|uniref:cytochrome c oxidase subunit II n=1 Tax=Salinarimonas rosea TaxID=552063 RepID=UPI000409A40B|nr:cytochrome c oxidase subunit II [Salinarimonas rosea]